MDRFYSKVRVNKRPHLILGTPCHEWIACLNNAGYGRFRWGKSHKGAHVISYMIHVGKIPKGLCVLHKCDNRKCVNPQHLWAGTNKDNSLDMIKKGRKYTMDGERSHFSKLTRKKVTKILTLIKKGATGVAIAERFNVSKNAISLIKLGKTWRHVC